MTSAARLARKYSVEDKIRIVKGSKLSVRRTLHEFGCSGLGMHIVYNLITQTLGGTVKCNSEPGKGTEFVVTIPMDSGQDEKEERPAAVSSDVGE